MVQNVSRRIAGRTHIGPLLLGNKTVCEQLTTLIQALAIMQQVNLMTAGRTHTRPITIRQQDSLGAVGRTHTGSTK